MNGVELIAVERQEQIEKHGFDSVHDSKNFNSASEMVTAAGYLLDISQGNVPGFLTVTAQYPKTWHPKFKSKFASKTRIEKLAVAGALIAAEIDRLQNQPSKCRICSCTDLDCSGCIEKTGDPCWWVGDDLCSACG